MLAALFALTSLLLIQQGTESASALPAYLCDVSQTGAVGDSLNDDTLAIQQALDQAGAAGGAVVLLPAGTYRINGHLVIPPGVTLQGIWQGPHHADQTWGSALFAYEGRGSAEGPALLELQPGSSVRGITIYYPEQKVKDIQPYPYAIRGRGMECSVENVTLVNAYQGIDFSAQHELHTIRNVRGCILRQAIIVDNCTDIGRIENVHLNPHYWARKIKAPGEEKAFDMNDWQPLINHLNNNLEAFIFARSDWEYVLNTFAFGFKYCYKFVDRGNGACNGNFLGIGADGGTHCLWVEKTQDPGLLITNGEFVAFAGENPIEVVTTPEFTGVVQLNNCSFWGPAKQCLLQQGNGLVSIHQCNFQDWGLKENNIPAIEVMGGELTVMGSYFARNKAHIRVHTDAGQAILLGNRYRGQEQVELLNQ